MSNKQPNKGQYQARLENQKAQLERHGNFAEVVIRTTPEGTDMINFARLWEHILVVADRQTRGYIAKNDREDFDKTRQDFYEGVDFMVKKMQDCIDRHDIDLTGANFVSRIAQRYKIAERKKGAEDKAPKAAPAEAAEAAAPVEAPKAAKKETAPKADAVADVAEEQVDGF